MSAAQPVQRWSDNVRFGGDASGYVVQEFRPDDEDVENWEVDYVDLDGPLLLDVPEPAFFGYDAGKLFMKPHPAFGDRR